MKLFFFTEGFFLARTVNNLATTFSRWFLFYLNPGFYAFFRLIYKRIIQHLFENINFVLLFFSSGVYKASVWTMALQGLTVDGVSGLNTVLAAKHAEEEYNTEEGPALTLRKCL